MTLRYYVIWPDGQRFGPADENLLTLWAAERRIGAGTLLEEEGTRRIVPANQIPSLHALIGGGTSPSMGPTWQSRSSTRTGSAEVVIAWILAVLGFGFMGYSLLFSLAAVVMSIVAISKRQPTAVLALLFSIFILLLRPLIGFLMAGSGLSF